MVGVRSRCPWGGFGRNGRYAQHGERCWPRSTADLVYNEQPRVLFQMLILADVFIVHIFRKAKSYHVRLIRRHPGGSVMAAACAVSTPHVALAGSLRRQEMQHSSERMREDMASLNQQTDFLQTQVPRAVASSRLERAPSAALSPCRRGGRWRVRWKEGPRGWHFLG